MPRIPRWYWRPGGREGFCDRLKRRLSLTRLMQWFVHHPWQIRFQCWRGEEQFPFHEMVYMTILLARTWSKTHDETTCSIVFPKYFKFATGRYSSWKLPCPNWVSSGAVELTISKVRTCTKITIRSIMVRGRLILEHKRCKFTFKNNY